MLRIINWKMGMLARYGEFNFKVRHMRSEYSFKVVCKIIQKL